MSFAPTTDPTTSSPTPTGPTPTGPTPTGPIPTGPTTTNPAPSSPIPTGAILTGPMPDPAGRRRRPLWLAALLVPLAVGAAAVALRLPSDDGPAAPANASTIAGAPGTPTSAGAGVRPPSTTPLAPLTPVTVVQPTGGTTAPTGGGASTGGGDAPAPDDVPAPTEPAAEEPPAPQPGVLSTAATVSVGTTGKGTLRLVNDGGSPITWALAGPAGVTFGQTEGTLEPGSSVDVAVKVSLAGRPTGTFTETVQVLSSGGDTSVDLQGKVLGLAPPPSTTAPLGLAPKK